eukprot:15315399-Heterocapsa_arctica.AAC.1
MCGAWKRSNVVFKVLCRPVRMLAVLGLFWKEANDDTIGRNIISRRSSRGGGGEASTGGGEGKAEAQRRNRGRGG